jgi:predicted amidohydrolase YtcJ
MLCFVALTRAAHAENAPTTLVLRHGRIYTMNAARSWAESVAIRDGRLVFVGADRDVQPYLTGARVVELHGAMVLPSFCDSHVHLADGGLQMLRCDLSGSKTAAEVAGRIRKYAAAHPLEGWIVGAGWDLPLYPQANPSRIELDRLVPDRPAILEAADGHSAWVNSRALQAAGIDRHTPDPPRGRIERDRQGNPSGTLREAAVDKVEKLLPPPDTETALQACRLGLKQANACGLTSVTEAAAQPWMLTAYQTLERQNQLTARVHACLVVSAESAAQDVAATVLDMSHLRETFSGGTLLKVNGAKMFADGVIESHTAALLEPYLGTQRHGLHGVRADRGELNFKPDCFKETATALDAAGFQIHVHAIGDRAVRTALDALQAAERANGTRDARHHIAHLQLIDSLDVPRFSRLGVVANFQAYWAFADAYVTKLTNPVLGPRRAAHQYPMASVRDTGAVMVGGSDWTVSSLRPLDAIEVAVTRRPLGDTKSASWLPDERLTLRDALSMYTAAGAWLAHEERETGTLEVGKSADLVVLDRDLFSVSPSKIHTVRVLATMLAGRCVFASAGSALSTLAMMPRSINNSKKVRMVSLRPSPANERRTATPAGTPRSSRRSSL